MNRIDLKKYNKEEKLTEEQKIIDGGNSVGVGLNESMEGKDSHTKLEDFKVLKVIDKGSFGKVFLVINKNT